MKKALALLLAVLMLLSSVAIVASAEGDAQPAAEINLQDLYGATYVGAALGADDAKPVQDGTIGENEYQAKYVVDKSGVKDTARGSVPAALLGDYTEYVSHDAEWIYVGFDFYNMSDNTRGRFYWNLSFIDSLDFTYNGGASANVAFTQGTRGIYDGWNFGAEIAQNPTTDTTDDYVFSTRNNAVTSGTAPDVNALPAENSDGVIDVYAVADKEVNADLNGVYTGVAEGVYTTHQTYEFKVSKAWYAAQVGLASAADVSVLAWATILQYANYYGTSYTQIGSFISAEDRAAFEALNGVAYTGTNEGARDNSYPYDNGMLPRAYILDKEPVKINVEDMPGYTPFYAGGEAIETAPVQDGVINDGEYSASRKLAPITANKIDFVDLSTYTNFTTEYVAYDNDYIYYAYENDAIYAAQAQFRFRLAHDYIVSDELTPHPSHRQLVDPLAQMITVGLEGFSAGTAPEGKTAPTEADIATGHTWDGSYAHAAVEIKISRAYLAAQMGLDSAADVTKLTYSTYGQDTKWDGNDWTYLHLDHLLTADQIAWLQDKGVTTEFGPATDGTQVSRLFNMIILDEAPPAEINLQDWYGATYVGAALGADDAKPVQDGTVNVGEYQAEYIVARGSMEEPAQDTSRFGTPMMLLGDFKQFVAHDADYFYVAFAFSNGNTDTRGRLYWRLSFLDSFNVTYTGGNTVADAFKQGEHALNDGWDFGGEVKADIAEGYSERNNAIVGTRGTAPVIGTDVTVAVGKVAPISLAGTNRQVYEFKISKAWYAAQVGLDSAADVRELGWVVLGQEINAAASSYTQIGHYIDEDDLAMLAATGHTYSGNGSGHPYDNQSLPLLFILDEAPDAEGEQPRVPAEVVEPMGGIVTPPDDGGDDGADDGTDDGTNNPPAQTEATTTEATTTAAATTTAKATTAAATTAAATEAKKGCKGSISISALVLLPTLAGGALLLKRRKED